MFDFIDLKTLSRPVRRVLAAWVGKLVDRLLHFRDQLRYGLIRMISTSVAETIEDQFHRSHDKPSHPAVYDDGYDDYYYDQGSYTPPAREVTERTPRPAPDQGQSPSGSWLGVLSHAASILMRWVRGPWAEPIMASAVTLISLLLVVR